MTQSRPLTPAERYYAFLDDVSPMNLMLVADLDTCFDIDLVARRWAQFSALRSLTRLRVEADLTLVDHGPGEVDFDGRQVASTDWDAALAGETAAPFGTGRPMRCRYFASPQENRSRLAFVVHHAVVDGRVGVAELQLFLRLLAGRPSPEHSGLTVPRASTHHYPWQTDPKARLALLRELRARNTAAGDPEPSGWPAASPDGRQPRFFSLVLEPGEADGLLAGARRHATRVYAAIATGWLLSVAGQLDLGPRPTLQLATPVDLAAPLADATALAAPVISVVADRHVVDASAPWELALRVRAGIEAATDRGDGDLFFELARVAAIDDLAVGTREVARALAGAPPAVSVTNLGTIDDSGDPEWVRSMCGYLAPTPNQVLFVSGLGYRGRLVHSIGTDDAQLAPDRAASLVAGYRSAVDRMAALASS